MSLPSLNVIVFSDYICPFCYVGHHRLLRLRDSYDLKINWCFVEIHPETSAEGEPIASLEYPSEHWNQLVRNLERVAAEENIPLAERSFTTNSKDALLLAEATKAQGRDVFYKLHDALFNAYFVNNKNIGDRAVLREIAGRCGISNDSVESAWTNPQYAQQLQKNFTEVRKYEVQSVPTFVFGEHVLRGVVSEDAMRAAAQEMLSSHAA